MSAAPRHSPLRASDRQSPWYVTLGVSLLFHGGLAAGLFYFSPGAIALERQRGPIELSERKLPEPPKKIEVKPEEPKEPDKPELPKDLPKQLPKQRQPKKPATSKRPPEPTQPPPTEQPPATDQPPTGPKIFGLPNMESTAKAAPGQGVAVPKGDTLEVDPRIRKRGPKTKIFKKEYKPGDLAPMSVVTTKPKLLKDVQPQYPQRLQDLGIEGRVTLQITVDGKGRVVKAKVLKGLHPELDKAALAAARKLRFSPAKVNGTPVKQIIPYSFVFVLD